MTQARPSATADKPNVVVIMADDLGYGDLNCYNTDSRIPTPNIDALAQNGLSFTDAHSPSAVCTPTRYSFLIGRYCWRTRLKQGVIGGYERPLIEPERLTMPRMLQQAGYATACIGKWHIGLNFQTAHGDLTEDESEVDFSKPVLGGPISLGFDYAYFNAGCGTCAPPYGFIENDRFIDSKFAMFDPGEGKGPVNVGAFGQWGGMMAEGWDTRETDVIITQKACDYIHKQADASIPFFMYLTPNAPHEPCVDRFVPEFAHGQSDAGARGDLVWLFDWIVGQVRDALAATGQLENTLLIITSDNGALAGDFVLDEHGQRVCEDDAGRVYQYETYGHRSNDPWRGYKSHIWEGGHREPLVLHWPKQISQGQVCDRLVCLTDIMATLASLIGYELPEAAAEDSCDFHDVVFPGDTSTKRPMLIHHSAFGAFAIRQGKWKLILGTDGSGGWPAPRDTPPGPTRPGQLYDLENDPQELQNLYQTQIGVVAKMTQDLQRCKDAGMRNLTCQTTK